MHPAEPPNSNAVRDRMLTEAAFGELRSVQYDVLTSGQGQRTRLRPVSRHFVRFAHTATRRSNEMPLRAAERPNPP